MTDWLERNDWVFSLLFWIPASIAASIIVAALAGMIRAKLRGEPIPRRSPTGRLKGRRSGPRSKGS